MDKFWTTKKFWITVLSVFLLAALMAGIDGKGRWLGGWVAYSILLGIGALTIYALWKIIHPGPSATTVALVSLFLRLVVGVALVLLLPIVGYQDNTEHLSGYVYPDAYIRDNQAWDLATSGAPLGEAFSGDYSGDQYGGMLAVGAFIYRTFSPDAHRPFLILILNAAISAWGVLCLWKASRSWFNEKTSLLAIWLFALYPESVLLGSSQMREAIVIPAVAIAFFGLTELQRKNWSGWFWIILSILILFPIQPLVGFISFVVLLGIWLFDPATLRSLKQRQTLLIIFLLVGILLFAMLVVSSILTKLPSLQGSGPLGAFLTWFENNFAFQSYLTERSSGIFAR